MTATKAHEIVKRLIEKTDILIENFRLGTMERLGYLATDQSPAPTGSAHFVSAPYQAFPTSDGWITVGAANQANWLCLIEVLEAPELTGDPRFKEMPIGWIISMN
jgi:crotonobetainyl-CoA:carnitine CoA-transferase CaiB-like acyl-CoA transferase